MSQQIVILDCYTDEPSGYGVRPYLGTHQLHLSQVLSHIGIVHHFITIDDLRYAASVRGMVMPSSDPRATRNTTKNAARALDLISTADRILVILGCFVDYDYFSCVPPRVDEVAHYLKNVSAETVAYFALGVPAKSSSKLVLPAGSIASFSQIQFGNAYRHANAGFPACPPSTFHAPDYKLLEEISTTPPDLLSQITDPVICEIETGTGCNHPSCSFCIESLRKQRVVYRSPESIVNQVKTLYDSGIRHFRLGRQPNIYSYQRANPSRFEALLGGIREACPEIRMLHVDNANAIDVVTPAGIQFTKILVEYGTAGNVAPMGIESFDEKVRRLNTVRGSVDDIMRAIEIVSSHGKERGTNGLPKLLPGINLIHGLPGADSASHAENLRCLRLILDQGFMTFRTFYRDLAPPTGVSLNRLSFVTKPKYEHYRRDIVEQFVIPMQEKVYPAGITLRGDWEIVQKGGEMHGRLFGSTPIRIALEGQVSPGCGIPLSVNVTGNRDYRLLTGKVVSEMNLEAL